MYTAPQSPQSIGGVIDSAIGLFKASFRYCWTAALLSSVVSAGLSMWLQLRLQAVMPQGARPDPGKVMAVLREPGVIGIYLLLILFGVLINLMMTAAIFDVAARRRSGSALGRFGFALPLLPGAVMVMIVVAIAMFFGFLLLIVPGVYLAVQWALWTPAYVDKGKGAFAALSTSWRLVRSNWWRTLAILSVVGVVVLVLVLVLGVVAGFLGSAASQEMTTRRMISQVLQGAAQVVYLPAITAAVVAVYQDLKLRKDGGDLEARLGNAGAAQA